jgi:hypothetical protein
MRVSSVLFTLAMLVLAAVPVVAQNATIYGKILDQQSGEELVGANVLLVGTSLGASTDIDGKFTVRNVPPGTYSIRISFVGYQSKVVSGFEAKAGETAKLDVALSAEAYDVEEVLVTAERVKATEAALLSDRKKSTTIGDGISAEQIKKAPDATSGDALKRVTGLTIVDDKFVFIRGVTDRYNGTTLNGVSVSSTDTDVDRKSFAFDMVPANLLENTVVVKTATPDMPGDFSGGMVQVNTLDFPTSRVIRVGLTSSYNTVTTSRGFEGSQGGSRDWLGFDDGIRAFPSEPMSTQQLAQTLPNTWAALGTRAPLNGSFNLAYGDRYATGDEAELGLVGALSYTNGFETQAFDESPTYVAGALPAFRFRGTSYRYDVLWSGILDFNYKLTGNHKLSFRNSYNQSAQDKVSQSEGINVAGSNSRRQSIEWDQRSLYLGQLGGEHFFPVLGGLEVKWKGFASSSRAEEPDRKQVEYTEGSDGSYGLGENYRTWSDLDEKTRGLAADVTLDYSALKFKAGVATDYRMRDFDIRAFSTIPGRNPQYFGLILLPIDQIFASENFDPGKFQFIESTTFTGTYEGSHRLNAYYAMLDLPIDVFESSTLRVTGGVRLENSGQHVSSPPAEGGQESINADLVKTDLLPSVNIKYSVGELLNVRLAHYQSVNRPEFRELANVLYLDFDTDQNTIGNPALQRAYVHNYDARIEVFPGVGEVVAVSYFTKTFHDAIEERLLAAPDRYVKTWFNSPSGTNRGWEFEVRKSLEFLGEAFRTLALTANYTTVSSEVEYTETVTDALGRAVTSTKTRPMQGQSPWTMNLGVQYTSLEWGTSFSVLYNKFGRRLSEVGDFRDYDVYEEPRDMVDLSVSQQLFSMLEAKFTVRNLFSKDRVRTTGEDRVPFSIREEGTAYGLSLSFSL